MLRILVYSVDSATHPLNNGSQAEFSVVLLCSSRDNQSLFQELSNIFSEDSNQQSSRELLMKVLHQYLFNFYTITDRFLVCCCAFCHQQVQAHKMVGWRWRDVKCQIFSQWNFDMCCEKPVSMQELFLTIDFVSLNNHTNFYASALIFVSSYL